MIVSQGQRKDAERSKIVGASMCTACKKLSEQEG